MATVPPTRVERPGKEPVEARSEPVRIADLAALEEPLAAPTPGREGEFAERYENVRVLGRGGMGEVLLAHDHRIGRHVAIKVARPAARDGDPDTTDGDDALRRFVREARVQGQLDHPAVVPVYDLGVRPDGAIYFTMKRVRGVTLDAALAGLRRGDADAERRWTRRRLLTAFVMICQAIELAHARGVIHRDLKPGNIMLGDYGEVYVLDWGVARLADEPVPPVDDVGLLSAIRPPPADELDGGELTITGTFLGTPGYMPPEQASGHPVDHRADVYALGAVLFEILTWQPLFVRESREAVIAATLAGADARASLRHPERGVPPELEEVCVKATAGRVDDRLASVALLRGAVEGFLDGDHDHERRTTLADQLAAAADESLPLALAGQRDARAEALQLASRALALAPDHPRAQDVIVRLTLSPPRTPPPEVIAAVQETERQTFRLVARITAFLYLTWLPVGALVLWMGLRDLTTFAVWGALMVATAGVMRRAATTARYDATTYFSCLVMSSAAVATTSRLFGPYVLTPTLLTVNTLGFFLHSRPAWRPATALVAVGAMLAPIALELTGVLSRTTTFLADRIVIHGGAADFGQPATSIALIGLMVAYAVATGLATARLRDRRLDDELRIQLAAWQLGQLVPEVRPAPTGPVEDERDVVTQK